MNEPTCSSSNEKKNDVQRRRAVTEFRRLRKPMNAYMIYLNHCLARHDERTSDTSGQWSAMTVEVKSVWLERCAEARRSYETALEELMLKYVSYLHRLCPILMKYHKIKRSHFYLYIADRLPALQRLHPNKGKDELLCMIADEFRQNRTERMEAKEILEGISALPHNACSLFLSKNSKCIHEMDQWNQLPVEERDILQKEWCVMRNKHIAALEDTLVKLGFGPEVLSHPRARKLKLNRLKFLKFLKRVWDFARNNDQTLSDVQLRQKLLIEFRAESLVKTEEDLKGYITLSASEAFTAIKVPPSNAYLLFAQYCNDLLERKAVGGHAETWKMLGEVEKRMVEARWEEERRKYREAVALVVVQSGYKNLPSTVQLRHRLSDHPFVQYLKAHGSAESTPEERAVLYSEFLSGTTVGTPKHGRVATPKRRAKRKQRTSGEELQEMRIRLAKLLPRRLAMSLPYQTAVKSYLAQASVGFGYAQALKAYGALSAEDKSELQKKFTAELEAFKEELQRVVEPLKLEESNKLYEGIRDILKPWKRNGNTYRDIVNVVRFACRDLKKKQKNEKLKLILAKSRLRKQKQAQAKAKKKEKEKKKRKQMKSTITKEFSRLAHPPRSGRVLYAKEHPDAVYDQLSKQQRNEWKAKAKAAKKLHRRKVHVLLVQYNPDHLSKEQIYLHNLQNDGFFQFLRKSNDASKRSAIARRKLFEQFLEIESQTGKSEMEEARQVFKALKAVPRSPCRFYVQERFQQLAAIHPELSQEEILPLVEAWSSIDLEQKAVYETLWQQRYEEYDALRAKLIVKYGTAIVSATLSKLHRLQKCNFGRFVEESYQKHAARLTVKQPAEIRQLMFDEFYPAQTRIDSIYNSVLVPQRNAFCAYWQIRLSRATDGTRNAEVIQESAARWREKTAQQRAKYENRLNAQWAEHDERMMELILER